MLSDIERTIGESFQARTKYRRDRLPVKSGDLVVTHKVYANPLEVAALPVPKLEKGDGVWSVLSRPRESIAEGGRLRLAEMSQILWAAAGFTYGGQRTHISSAGVTGVETYVIVRQLEDCFAGVYHYNVKEHSLEYLVNIDPVPALQACLLGHGDVSPYAVVLAFTGLPKRIDDGAASRVYRHLYLEAGAAAQSATVAASSLELASHFGTEFYDDELATLLQVDGVNEFPLCVVSIGT
jgi:SagB-type dehydrogenase family enzyme